MVVIYDSDPESAQNQATGETREYVTEGIDGEVYSTDKYALAEVDYVELENNFEERGALFSLPGFDDLVDETSEPHWHNFITGEEEPGYFFEDASPFNFEFDPDFSEMQLDLSNLEWEWDEKSMFILTLIDYGVDAITWFYNNAIPRVNLVPEGQETVEIEPW